ncbi:CPBP family glutamic-type intramembrane protease [Leptospira terpstrae]
MVNLIDTFLYGLTFSFFFNKYKNVWPLIIAHILTDVIAFYPNY